MKKRFLVILSLLFICGGIALAAVGKVKGGSFSWRFDLAKFKVVAGNNDYISETVKVGAFAACGNGNFVLSFEGTKASLGRATVSLGIA